MKLNPLTNEKLQIEILKYINSFPCTSPRDEPTRITIYNHFTKDKKINIEIIEHNLNKLKKDGFIQVCSNSHTRGETFSLTPKGELIINSKSKLFRNKNTINKITTKNISIPGNSNIIMLDNNVTININTYLRKFKKTITESKLPTPEKKKWFSYIKEITSHPIFIEIFKKTLEGF